ncbi:hypothetical protein C7S14_0471 [Burkholderia cepacia]|nr:hypothetical protein C7S14_0471 [Burkholderia cepacia]
MARRLRREHPKRSTPSAKMLEPIVWPESFDDMPVTEKPSNVAPQDA